MHLFNRVIAPCLASALLFASPSFGWALTPEVEGPPGSAPQKDGCGPIPSLRELKERLAALPPSSPATNPGQSWDRKSAPRHLELIEQRFGLTTAERAKLDELGFLVSARLEQPDYANAYHELHRSQLPIYVSVDSILHAVFKGTEQVIERSEEVLQVRLSESLRRMHRALPGRAGQYPAEVARDLDLYLTVARSLLVAAGGAEDENDFTHPDTTKTLLLVTPVFPESSKAAWKLAMLAIGAPGGWQTVELFGRERVVDFSAFKPRGHYISAGLQHYFRSVMWLSRIVFNLVSRDCRVSAPEVDVHETPREAIDAFAFADLAEASGAAHELRRVEELFSLLAGKRDGLSLHELMSLRQKAGRVSLTDADAFEKLKAAVGEGYRRAVATQPMPDAFADLPVVASPLGARLVPDVSIFPQVVQPLRPLPSVADLAHAFGNDRAKQHLAKDLERWRGLSPRLDRIRAQISAFRPGDNLYDDWFAALRGLGERPPGALPSFMRTGAFSDLRISSIAAGFGQLRHAYVLIAAEPYIVAGCEIPSGYVEPAPALFEGLIRFVERLDQTARHLPGQENESLKGYPRRMLRVLKALRSIANQELAGQPLSVEARQFLAMVVETMPLHLGGGYGPNPPDSAYDGWYFELFPDKGSAFEPASLIADYAMSETTVAYAGALQPRLGVFVIDSDGSLRVAVGPVARGFELFKKGQRLSDVDIPALGTVKEPWSKSYTVQAPKPPKLTISCSNHSSARRVCTVIGAEQALSVSISRLDFHRQPAETVVHPVGPTPVIFEFTREIERESQMLQIRTAPASDNPEGPASPGSTQPDAGPPSSPQVEAGEYIATPGIPALWQQDSRLVLP